MATTAVRNRPRTLRAAAVLGALLWTTSACGKDSSAKASEPDWQEPSSYTYTLTSSEGERALIGTFDITVRDAKVVKAVGLDESARRVVKQLPDQVPTIGDLLDELAQAREDGAHQAEVEHAGAGHPVRIWLDWEENAIDDEALYVISDYEPLA
ncbi:hypothetical protein FE633_00100 [Streptomyces montanus]|uniref:Lipoprotein n=1 Tax=Streptomyces montanus TaxID=2580423 RepID=A0A5R9FVN0_9ACTN|nr:hypothetical protein FE633_00100 [Streptomyces montanus]